MIEMSDWLAQATKFQGTLGGGGWASNMYQFLPRLHRTIAMTGIKPILVVMPTADSEPCDELAQLRRLWDNRQLNVREFHALNDNMQEWPDAKRARELLDRADVVLVLGGLFPELMYRWRETGIDSLMLQAVSEGSKFFVGASSGLIWPFAAAQTRERRLGLPLDRKYHLEPGLGLFPAIVCPHYGEFNPLTGTPRAVSFRAAMINKPVGTVGIGVCTHAALEIQDGIVRIVGQDPYAVVQRLETISPRRVRTTTHKIGDVMSMATFFAPS
jgi:peptidase E